MKCQRLWTRETWPAVFIPSYRHRCGHHIRLASKNKAILLFIAYNEHCSHNSITTFCLFFVKLGDLVELVRGRLSKMQRAVLSALIVIEVHAKDVAAKMMEQGVSSVSDFEWISQLRLSVCSVVLHMYGLNVK